MTNWYAAKAGNDSQGLVIEESTGRNVAVTYDKADAELVARSPAMQATLAAIDEFCQMGLNSSEPKHWEAALQDILDIMRRTLPAESTAAPTPTAESKPRLACPNCGDETHIYARCDARWNPETGGWIALELEDELDCTECDHAWPCPNELKP